MASRMASSILRTSTGSATSTRSGSKAATLSRIDSRAVAANFSAKYARHAGTTSSSLSNCVMDHREPGARRTERLSEAAQIRM